MGLQDVRVGLQHVRVAYEARGWACKTRGRPTKCAMPLRALNASENRWQFARKAAET